MDKISQITTFQNFQTLEKLLEKMDTLMRDFQTNRTLIKNIMTQIKTQILQLEKIRSGLSGQTMGSGATQSGADDGSVPAFWRKNKDYGK